MQQPRLALVPGEPAGVGPELVARALQRGWDSTIEVFGDGEVLVRAAEHIGLPLSRIGGDRLLAPGGEFTLHHVPAPRAVVPGLPEPGNARSTVAALLAAASAAIAAVRVIVGPSLPDRVVATDLFGTICVGMLTVGAAAAGQRAFLDAAIIIALVAFVGNIAYARFIERK